MRNPDTIADAELIAGLKQDDTDSYAMVFRKYYRLMLHFVTGMLKDPQASEDVTQDIFMKVWINRHNLDTEKSLKNYLLVLARNRILDIMKSGRSSRTVQMDDGIEAHGIVHGLGQVEDDICYAETFRHILAVVSKMPPKRREVFMMSRYQNMSNEEISTTLKLSVRTVEKHIELALRDLRRHLN